MKQTSGKLIIAAGALAMAMANGASAGGRADSNLVIYVESQGLYYDSLIAAKSLPQKGRFQKLVPTPDGLTTEWGPGDRDFVGGRWWIDSNNDGEMDDMDTYFSCPLLGPGRTEP